MSPSLPDGHPPAASGETVVVRAFRGSAGANRGLRQLDAAGLSGTLRERTGSIEVLVRAEDADRAREVLGAGRSFRVRGPGVVSVPSVRAELAKLQGSSATAGFLTLVLTIGIFVALGLAGSSPVSIGLLVAVLFLHELGHLAGMKAFGYRDVRMFFIPLFGAAVSGRETNPSATRQAIVSLLGPAPGIFLGIAAGLAYVGTASPILATYAATSLVLNTFNLLPFHPLDGGRVLEATLFSRHPWTDVAFRVVGALALGALAWFEQSIVLGLFALFLLSHIQIAWPVARISHELRSRLDVGEGSAEEIPDAVLDEIVSALNAGMPEAARQPKAFAVQAQEIWRRMRSAPCSAGVAVGFAAILFLLFALGAVATVAFAVFRLVPLE